MSQLSPLGEDLVWYQDMWYVSKKWEPAPYPKACNNSDDFPHKNKKFVLHAVKGPPRYYYHVSEDDLRPDHIPEDKPFLLFPRGHGNNRSSEELTVPRICVADNIWACLSAVGANIFFSHLPGIGTRDSIHVYRTVSPHIAYYPREVLDCQLTRERWLVSPDMNEEYGFDFVEITNLYFDVDIFYSLSAPLKGISLANPREFKAQVGQTHKLWKLLEKYHIPREMTGDKKTHVWFSGRMIPVGQVELAIEQKMEEEAKAREMAC